MTRRAAAWFGALAISLAGALRGSLAGEPPWTDAVEFRLPEDPRTRARTARGVEWLKRRTARITRPGDREPIPVVAWKDPTLDPDEPNVLAGYLITDTLWAAKALKPFDAEAAASMERGLQRLDAYGDGLRDVLFHPIDRPRHRCADADFVHGRSLGRFPIDGGRIVDVRAFLQVWDAAFDIGHPARFAEHAAYQAIHDFWNGRDDEARRRILGIVANDRDADPNDFIFWDDRAGVLVDYASRTDWERLLNGERATYPHCSFKLGALLYAIRLTGLESAPAIAPRLKSMRARLWSAQADDGGTAHFIPVGRDGGLSEPARGATGEATAIAILAETVQPAR